MHFSANARSWDRMSSVCPSVRPSVCPSVCLSVCNVGGLWSHRLEILETNCTDNLPNTFALCSQKAIHLLPGEHGEILGKLEVALEVFLNVMRYINPRFTYLLTYLLRWGREKVAWWRTKAAISLKRVKIEKKLLWMVYRNLPTLFRMVLSPTPYGLPFPKIGGSQPPPKTAI